VIDGPARAIERTSDRPAPRIVARTVSVLSRWFKIVERQVDFGDGKIEVYHGIEQYDFIAILAVTPDGRIPIVRQYRPALERFTWEFPAGLLDSGDTPEEACIRELAEETGLVARRVHPLGQYAPDTARFGNRVFSFFVETEANSGAGSVEPGIEVDLVKFDRLCDMIRSGEFCPQLHIGVIWLAMLRPDLARLLRRASPP
jgi:ADP-ribose pyrophosphatase